MIPYWYLAVVVAVLSTTMLAAGWWSGRAVGRSGRAELAGELMESRLRVAHLEGRLEGRAERRPVPSGPPIPPAWPEPAAPETVDAAGDPTAVLPQVGSDPTLTAADRLVPGRMGAVAYETLAALGPASEDADAALDRTWDRVPEPAGPDLDGAYDVFGSDDEDDPDDGGGDEPGPPSALPAPAFGARIGWSAPVAPAGYGVMPDARLGQQARMFARRARLRQWLRHPVTTARQAWAGLRTFAAEKWEAWFPADSGGWAPGEVCTAGLTGDTQALPVIARAKVMREKAHQARHVWGWRMVSAAALLSGTGPELPPGRHRAGAVPGTSAQKDRARLPVAAEVKAWAYRVASRHGRLPLLGVNRPAVRLS